VNGIKFALIFSVLIPLLIGSTQEISGDIEVDSIPFSPGVTLQLSGMSVGGDYFTLDTTALLLAGMQTNIAWIIPVLAAAGIGAVVLRKKF